MDPAAAASAQAASAAADSAASRVPFSDLCRLFKGLATAPTRPKRAERWRAFLEKFRKQLYGASDGSMHTLLRLILPQLDRKRGAYGLKEHRLADMYTRALQLGRDSRDAVRMRQYQSSGSTQQGGGDFAETVLHVLQHRCPPQDSGWTVQEVDSRLTELAERHQAGDPAGVAEVLTHMIRTLSGNEQKWLVCIILKEMHLGIGQKELLRAFHPDANDHYDVTFCLQRLTAELRDPSVRMHEAEIRLFTAFRPMLSEQSGLESLDRQMRHKPFYVEPKHDGERVQLHKDGNKYMFFSRGGFDFSASYGSSPQDGSLVPYIQAQFTPETRSCILDGEMLVWNDIEKRIIVKAEAPDVKKLHPGGPIRPLFVPFDLVFLNGKVMTNTPLSERLEKLKYVYRPLDGWLGTTTRSEASTHEEVAAALNAAIDNHEEGLILKDPTSTYHPNARKKGWVKVKPDYVNSLVDDLDMLIIGGYFGTGARRGTITSFLLGAAEPPENPEDTPTVFSSAGTVTSGLTSAQLSELQKDLVPHMKKTRNDGRPPPGLQWAREKPHLWISPRHSRLLQIKATEIVESRAHAAGLVPRFARVVGVRKDKRWCEGVTKTELQRLRERAEGKLATSHLASVPESRPGRAATVAPSVVEHMRPADLSGLRPVSDLLEGRQLCVMSCQPARGGKDEVERLVYECGGSLTQNPTATTWCVIADSVKYRERGVIKGGRYDVVRSSWLRRSRSAGRLLPFSPSELLHATPETQLETALHYDRFGDSYADDISVEALKTLVDDMPSDSWQLPLPAEISDLAEGAPFHLLAGCQCFLPAPRGGSTVASLLLRLHGGKRCNDVKDGQCSHVITEEESEELREVNRGRKRKFQVVWEEWLLESVKQARWVEERAFPPRSG